MKKDNEALLLADAIVKGMEEKKAKDIVRLDLRNVKGAVADFFVICHGDSDTQVEAIGKSIEEEVDKALNEGVWHREGFENCEWVLLDYVNVVAHVFQRESRGFYAIEDLWGDAVIKKYD